MFADWLLRSSSSRRAMTLVECIAAVVILALAAPPLLLAARTAAHAQADPVLMSTARWLATEKLEDVIADRHSSTRGFDWVSGAHYLNEAPVAGFPAFSRSVSVESTGVNLVSAGSAAKVVTVTVSWQDSRGRNQNLSVATALTDY